MKYKLIAFFFLITSCANYAANFEKKVGILTDASSKSAVPPIENDNFFIFNIVNLKEN